MLNGKQIVPVQTRSKTMLKIYTMQIKKKSTFSLPPRPIGGITSDSMSHATSQEQRN